MPLFCGRRRCVIARKVPILERDQSPSTAVPGGNRPTSAWQDRPIPRTTSIAAPPRCTVAFIGTAGVPNRYGGFEAFVDTCGPAVVAQNCDVVVTCDRAIYPGETGDYGGMQRIMLDVPANGAQSILHDLVAFLRVLGRARNIVVLGVSGGIWFPFFRFVCALTGRRLIVNIDGVEWQRGKHSPAAKSVLRAFDWLAQRFAHAVVYDNAALAPFVSPAARHKAVMIAYAGDHVRRRPDVERQAGACLTICRIEPENNIHLLIDGFLASAGSQYTVVGNWNASEYGRSLRTRHANNPRLRLLDPIYEADELSALRESCEVYLHGHSVGGTNPSLVEMVFYECRLLCFDVPYHRATVGEAAGFFRSQEELAALLDAGGCEAGDRESLRQRYSRQSIAWQYGDLFTWPVGSARVAPLADDAPAEREPSISAAA